MEACELEEGRPWKITAFLASSLAQSLATLDPSPELRLATGRHRDRLGKSVGVAAAKVRLNFLCCNVDTGIGANALLDAAVAISCVDSHLFHSYLCFC